MPFTFACAAVLRVPSEFLLIQEAVSAASEGDTVLVASGTYTGAGNKDIDFTGVNMVVLGEAGAGSTIIDCEGSGRGFNFHSGENHESVVRGFTIARGHVWSRDGGGAIRCYESSPTIQECVFEECMGLSGGAVLAERSSLIVEDCAFLACVGGEGGAICLYWPQGAIVERCWFEGCHSEATLVNYGGRVEIRDCAIVDNYNSAVSTWFSFAVSEVERCTIVRNYGYALHSVYGGSTTARNCIIAFNGSATHCYQSMPLASHCAVFENTSSDSLCGNAIENLLTDPLFCDPSLDELALCADSPCLAGGNPWGEQIGAFGEGCPPCATPVARESWGCIKSLYR
jgi:hypothetical protein